MRYILYIFVLWAFSFEAHTISIKGTDVMSPSEIEFNTNGKKGIVLYFLSSACPCSQGHFNYFNRVVKKYKNFEFVGVHSSKKIKKSSAKKYFGKKQLQFPVIFDPDLELANRFEALKTPHIFVLNAEGKILYQGGATDSRNPANAKNHYLENALEAIENNKEPELKYAKTIGCYIQR